MTAPGTPHQRALALLDALETELEGLAYNPGNGWGGSTLADIGEGHLGALRGIVASHERLRPVDPRVERRVAELRSIDAERDRADLSHRPMVAGIPGPGGRRRFSLRKP